MSASDVFNLMMEAAPLSDKLRETVKDEPFPVWFTAMLMAILGMEVKGKAVSAETIAMAARTIAHIRDEANAPGSMLPAEPKDTIPLDGGMVETI